jgi:hypothetical protein
MGGLVPAVLRKETGRGKKLPDEREVSEIPSQRLSEFRKLAAINCHWLFEGLENKGFGG